MSKLSLKFEKFLEELVSNPVFQILLNTCCHNFMQDKISVNTDNYYQRLLLMRFFTSRKLIHGYSQLRYGIPLISSKSYTPEYTSRK